MEITNFVSEFESLPKKIQKQVLDYVEFLMTKYSKENGKKQQLKFDWEDGISNLKNEYSSVDLQHQANFLR